MSKTTSLLLRVGVAIAFIYPPISALIEPLAWVGYFPSFISALPIDSTTLLHIFGAFEVIIGLWILSGKKILVPSALAVLSLAAIVLFNLAQMDVLFRDIPIALMAFALALDAREKKTSDRLG